jgi:hypothetical protein
MRQDVSAPSYNNKNEQGSMVIIFLFSILFAAIIGLMVYRSRTAGTGYVSAGQLISPIKPSARPDNRPAIQRNDFRAVSIECGTNACGAARRLEGKRGLHAQIPQVPLSQCDAESCECRYQHHIDRRSEEDRRAEYFRFNIAAAYASTESRRSFIDRRANNNTEMANDASLEVFNMRS